MIDANLSLIPHIEYICHKIQQHIYFADLDPLELVARLSVFQMIIPRVMLYWSGVCETKKCIINYRYQFSLPLMENTNFCPPAGDSESLHLNRPLSILLLDRNQCAAN